MQCKCGSATIDRNSVRKGIGEISWPECATCGMVGRPFTFLPEDGGKVIEWDRPIDWPDVM